MKTARIFFATGTGGTALVARFCADILGKAAWQIETPGLADPVPDSPADLEIFAFPVYAFSVPEPFASRIKGLKRADTPALVLACHGGGPLGAAERCASLLKRRGRRVIGHYSPLTPAQWTQTGEIPKAEAVEPAFRKVRENLETWLPLAVAGVDTPGSRAPADPYGVSVPLRLGMGIPGFLYSKLGRHVLGLIYAADPDCTGCGLCARECPGKCIHMVEKRGQTPGPGAGSSSRPRWGLGCSGCNRCINRCPVEAIQCTWLRLGAFMIPQLAGFVLLVWAWIRWGLVGAGAGLGGLLVLTVLQLLLLPPLLDRLEGNPALRGFALAGWTRGFRRYMAPKELKD